MYTSGKEFGPKGFGFGASVQSSPDPTPSPGDEEMYIAACSFAEFLFAAVHVSDPLFKQSPGKQSPQAHRHRKPGMLPAREVRGLAFRFHQIGVLLLPQVAAVQLLKLLDSVEEINAGDAKRPCTSPRQGRAQTISNTTSLVSRVCSATRSSTATSLNVTPLPPTNP
jgi:hypothetical protein